MTFLFLGGTELFWGAPYPYARKQVYEVDLVWWVDGSQK